MSFKNFPPIIFLSLLLTAACTETPIKPDPVVTPIEIKNNTQVETKSNSKINTRVRTRVNANISLPAALTKLPNEVATLLNAKGASQKGMSVYVQAVSSNRPLLAFNADIARNPASVMKLITTYASLGILGPNYQWPIELYSTGNIAGGILHGDLILKGYGYPDFKPEDLKILLKGLRQRGVKTISGNLIFDNTHFKIKNKNAGAFDGKPYARYNALPDALLYNERKRKYSSTKGVSNPVMIYSSFRQIWITEMGGVIGGGKLIVKETPNHAHLLYRLKSRPVKEILPLINKKSNNVMARQLFLSLATNTSAQSANTVEKSYQSVQKWFVSRGLQFPELRIENGSGLSRVGRISARHIGELLMDAYTSPHRKYLVHSLPIMGVDGTLKRRMRGSIVANRSYMKTGTLKNARGIAGYVKAQDGQVYIVVILHNTPATWKVVAAHNKLIEWTARQNLKI